MYFFHKRRTGIKLLCFFLAGVIVPTAYAITAQRRYRKSELLYTHSRSLVSTETQAALERLESKLTMLSSTGEGIAREWLCTEIFADCSILKLCLSEQEAGQGIYGFLAAVQQQCREIIGGSVVNTNDFSDTANLLKTAVDGNPEELSGLLPDYAPKKARGSAAVPVGKSVTRVAARKTAAEFLGIGEEALTQSEDITVAPERYAFSAGSGLVTVAKQGGRVCTYTSAYIPGELTIDESAATDIAGNFLVSRGFDGVRLHTVSSSNGICELEYVSRLNDGWLNLNCAVHIGVSMDTGTVTSFDARSFLTDTAGRTPPEETVTRAYAEGLLPSHLSVSQFEKVFANDISGVERCCYEFTCTGKGTQKIRVYLDATDAQTVNVELL